MTTTAVFVGIDIAKTDCVVACRPDGTSWIASNDAAGITATVDRLRAVAPTLIVLEATGGDETSLVAALAAASLPVVVANPRQVRDFAKATPDNSPRPTASMRISLRSLRNGCTPRRGRCRMRPCRNSRLS